jgi:hypothetical protein
VPPTSQQGAPMLDVRIDGGLIVDGTGAPGRVGSIGIRGDKIVAIGELAEPAKRVIDATGKVVAPGFVDIHTHYDAQVFWDPTLSPSSNHGVTSVVGGNCGFSIAPLTPEAGAYLMPMLSRVEGMPIESLKAGVPWDWRTFGEYLGKLDGKLAINAGFLVGHCAVRRVVMKERSVGHAATPEELAEMVALLQQSVREGGLGFSTSLAPTHNDGAGEPVPSRHATREEVVALCRALRDPPAPCSRRFPAPASGATKRSRSWPTCRSRRIARSTGTCSRRTRSTPASSTRSSRRVITPPSAARRWWRSRRPRARRCASTWWRASCSTRFRTGPSCSS